MAEAVEKNLSLMAEKQNVPVAQARVLQASLRPNPILSANWDYLDWLRRGYGVHNTDGPPEYNAHFDYPMERGGKRDRRIEVAEKTTSVAELRFLDSMRLLVLSVQSAFVDLLSAKESLALAQQNLAVFNSILTVNEAKVKAGELAGVEVTRTRVAQQQFENTVRQAQLHVRTASNILQSLLGRTALSPEFDIAGGLRSDPQVVLLDEIRAQALQIRPDLLAQRKDAERAEADIRLQKANGKWDYTIGSGFHRQYDYANGITFGIYYAMPLQIHNRNQGEILRAQREYDQAGLRTRAVESGIIAEVENAWQQYNTAKDLLQRISGLLVPEARQVREITEYSYRRGEASLLEFLDAQRAYNDAIQGYNDARADYTRSLHLIDAVTGRSVNR